MRHWLITWTTYGTWLPGDPRGSVTAVRDREDAEPRVHHNLPDTPYVPALPALHRAARQAQQGPTLRLTSEHANVLLAQFRETAEYRGWLLDAVAIMANHVHLVLTVEADPDPSDLLRDFKAYGARALNRRWGKPDNGTWWTDHGSKRKLPNESARQAAIRYVQNQSYPLIVWTPMPNPGETNPGETNPGETNPGETNPGETNPGEPIP